jgi:hypothetical protein
VAVWLCDCVVVLYMIARSVCSDLCVCECFICVCAVFVLRVCLCFLCFACVQGKGLGMTYQGILGLVATVVGAVFVAMPRLGGGRNRNATLGLTLGTIGPVCLAFAARTCTVLEMGGVDALSSWGLHVQLMPWMGGGWRRCWSGLWVSVCV